VRINLGNLPVAKVEKKSIIDRIVMLFVREAVAQGVPEWTGVVVVHLGAFDANNQLVAKKSINASSVPENGNVTFDVPAGIRRRIVVLGEVISGKVNFYGNSDELNLNAGTVVTVEIGMDDTYLVIANPSFGKATWNNITGASLYNIYDSGGTILYGTVTDNEYIAAPGSYNLSAFFGFADRESKNFSFSIGFC